ncbi:MAG: serine protease, partial [Chloroflexi bacterium]|nr:serine protease [Chloroflexota bacterium]
MIFFIWLGASLACSLQAEPTPTAIPTPRPTSTPSRTPTPAPTATPTETPTPAPLSSIEIFDLVSPSVAFVETPIGFGSGILLADGYVLTNAHVVWPYNQVRLVFADGSEHLDVPVVNWDWIADLAVLGPIETAVAPQALVNGEELVIGSEVYLIGYPGEVDEFPEPTITR